MQLLQAAEFAVADTVARLLDCNPFLAERVELERQALGPAFVPTGPVWHSAGDAWISNPNTPVLRERLESLVAAVHPRLATAAAGATSAELDAWRSTVFYLLWLRYEDDLYDLIEPPAAANGAGADSRAAPPRARTLYDRFARDVATLLAPLPGPPPDTPHLFAVAFQARRAFHFTFRKIFGASRPAARLRAAVWNTLFTREPARYRRSRFRFMRDVSILVTGESGTGKELVSRAIALSQYIPFDPASAAFAANPEACFHALNASTLGPSVIEAELFGHSRGAFTGAESERAGWFETCGPHDTIFLDELGDLEASVQVKLLRVIENRTFQRMGETTDRHFAGKIVAATNRNLHHDIDAGRFRADFYNRVRTVAVQTPTLREQLADCPDDLHNLLLIAARRAFGPDEAPEIAAEVAAWIDEHLGQDYPWTGNMRELEQCVRSVVVAGEHDARRTSNATAGGAGSAAIGPTSAAAGDLGARMGDATITVDELRDRYVEMTYARLGSFHETGQRLGVDWRTVKRIVGRTTHLRSH